MDSWHSYPKVYAIGHAAVKNLFLGPVVIEEKVDGSQFSFGKYVDATGAEYLRCRSRGAELNVEAPDHMFKLGVQTARDLFPQLRPGWAYRGEYLNKPKHNTLCYGRVPARHFILFDVTTGLETYLPRAEKESEAARLGLEVVPLVHAGVVESVDMFRALLDRDSVLGGQKVEGVVAKNYAQFGLDGKALFGKFVSEAFKEVHAGDWKERNPTQGDVVQRLIEKFKTPARWAKAVQHLREAGKLEGSPRDIGPLMECAAEDIDAECATEIRSALFAWAWPQLRRGVLSGLPEWYKDELLKSQFSEVK